jgi:hypothetical protein
MTAESRPAEVELAATALYQVPDASLVRFTCREGALWITLDDDPRDIVLEAGGEFSTAAHRRAIVYALQPSRLYVEPTERSPTAPIANRARYSRKAMMETFSRFQAMPLTKAAR